MITLRYRLCIVITLVLIAASLQIEAQENFDCDIQADIYLFDYADSIWTAYVQTTRDVACDVHYFWSTVARLGDEYETHPIIVQEYVNLTTPASYPLRTQNGACNDRPSTYPLTAYYCRNPNGIVISEPTQFIDYLTWQQNGFGDLKVALSLAHEWGHHIQLPIVDIRTRELQAECYVGDYFQFATTNQELTRVDVTVDDWDAFLRVIPIDESEDVMVGTSGTWSTISVIEQGMALRLGYNQGVLGCFNMADE